MDHPPSPVQREMLDLVFDNTRQALARILRTAEDRDQARQLIRAFRSYQLPGLDGLLVHLRDPAHRPTTPEEPGTGRGAR